MMPVYVYQARNTRGELISGEVTFETEEEIRSYLSARKLIPVEIKTKSALDTDLSKLPIFKSKVKTRDIALFCRQFAIMLESGITIGATLDIVRRQIENPTLKEIVQKVYEDVQKGRSLSEAMGDHPEFPPLLVSMIESGEVSGSLDEVMVQMAGHYEKNLDVQRKVKSALTYPAITVTLILILMVVLIAFVIPNFLSMYASENLELPWVTRALMSITEFTRDNFLIIMTTIISLIAGFFAVRRTPKGKHFFDELVLKLPIASNVNKMVITANFCRTLSTLLKAGTPIIKSMEIVRRVVGNEVAMDVITNSIEEIKQGTGLAISLHESDLFPDMLTSMIRIGEETGALDFTMEKTADFYEAEADLAIQNATTVINPAITIAVGAVVGFVVLAVMLPAFNMLEAIL